MRIVDSIHLGIAVVDHVLCIKKPKRISQVYLDLFVSPPVQIHRLYPRNVRSHLAVQPTTANTQKHSQVPRCPSCSCRPQNGHSGCTIPFWPQSAQVLFNSSLSRSISTCSFLRAAPSLTELIETSDQSQLVVFIRKQLLADRLAAHHSYPSLGA